jgi:hydrogenase maturation protein HypF
MAVFSMCPACRREYEDPGDRRFHAQPNACPECGPRVSLVDADGRSVAPPQGGGPIDAARALIGRGKIVAIKGLGGFHLACDATDDRAVARLRRRKRRYHKAFALMAGDLEMIRGYAKVGAAEEAMLGDKSAPIVVLEAAGKAVAPGVAPGQSTLGFMLPYTPLHHLLLRGASGPIVLTSGNRSDEPQCTGNREARERLRDIADYWLLHDREIANRLDDSVIRLAAGRPRFLRRARGYAPDAIALPQGFADAPPILAMGGELKNTFCLLNQGRAVVSQHIGDLEEAAALKDYTRNLRSYAALFDHRPEVIGVDLHPAYRSSRLGRDRARGEGLRLVEIQHHHAHIASCMAEQGLGVDTRPVLGVALDGLGYGGDGSLWGGEFLLADYRGYRRLAHFLPVPMLGGDRAAREPWRNAYAHLASCFGWQTLAARYPQLEIVRRLSAKPLETLDLMLARGLNSPPASSCGRLFDAVAAVLGICAEATSFEGQAAMELESLAGSAWDVSGEQGYSADRCSEGQDRVLRWRALWEALLEDLNAGASARLVAARFHRGLAAVVAGTARELCDREGADTVVLSGGSFQNRLLLEQVSGALQGAGLRVLIPEKLPASDGGLSLGQAVVAAAQCLAPKPA